jgi:predicted metal-dependent hydrolase
MAVTISLGGLDVEVIRKDIKNMHLSVLPPEGHVRVAAPERTSLDTIRAFAALRLPWIKRHRRKMLMQDREPPREFLDRETHFIWGQRAMLEIVQREGAPIIQFQPGKLTLCTRANASTDERNALLQAWYRAQVRTAAMPTLNRLEAQLGVKANRLFVQRMKTKWGSCNPLSGNIRLNTDLARKPAECLDYVILHELAHLREPTHSAEFYALLDCKMPQWREVRQLLNSLPLATSPDAV